MFSIEFDADTFLESLESAISTASSQLLAEVANEAKEQLTSLDRAEGHHNLADLWTSIASVEPEGAAATVFSLAEDMTFYNKHFDAPYSKASGAARFGTRVPSSEYPVEGYRLLAILEGGAKDHPIYPGTITDAQWLTIPLPGSESEFRLSEGVPRHPGVTGNRNVERTTEEVDVMLETAGDGLGAQIEAEMD